MTREAYGFVRMFAAEPARDLCVDHHYLLCASAGALRLEAGPDMAAPTGTGCPNRGGPADPGKHPAASEDLVGAVRHRIRPAPAGAVDGV
jgi:hypothetical protein